MGEHVRFSDELADRICDRLASGDSMRRICADPGMPNRRTVERWMDADPAFAAKCARAREIGFDERADAMRDEIDAEPDVQRAKLIFSYEAWRLSKLAPKRFGDKLELDGKVGLTVMLESDADKL